MQRYKEKVLSLRIKDRKNILSKKKYGNKDFKR